MSAHTPGPWRLDTGSNPGSPKGMAVCEGPFIIANVVDLSNHAKANARLIAAAPELLAALELFVGWYSIGEDSQNAIIRRGRDVIAKATGGEL
jgi:hypothetical protein